MGLASLFTSSTEDRDGPLGPGGVHAFRLTEQDLTNFVATRLKADGWAVELDAPIAGRMRPDILATKSGQAYIVEVKVGNADLGALAQVEAYSRAACKERGQHYDATLVVIDAPSELDAAAANAGIELVRVDANDLARRSASV